MLVVNELCNDSLEQAIAENQRALMLISNDCDFEESKEVNPEAHVHNYAEETVPTYTDFQFKTHFRMYPDVFEVRNFGFLWERDSCNCTYPSYVILIINNTFKAHLDASASS